MSYVPIHVHTPQVASSRAKNLSYKLQEVIQSAQANDPGLDTQDIEMALQLARPAGTVQKRAAIAFVVAVALLVLGVVAFLVLGAG